MKNIHEVLRAKEQQLQQIQKEIEALKTAARLLAEESEAAPGRAASSTNVAVPQMVMRPAQPAPATAPAAAPKESASYVAASAWDVAKPQFP